VTRFADNCGVVHFSCELSKSIMASLVRTQVFAAHAKGPPMNRPPIARTAEAPETGGNAGTASTTVAR
jgi:hypothetical protein